MLTLKRIGLSFGSTSCADLTFPLSGYSKLHANWRPVTLTIISSGCFSSRLSKTIQP